MRDRESKNNEIQVERGLLLAEALRNVLVAAGVLRKDAWPSGPNLLLAAEDYVKHKKEEDNEEG